MPPDINITLMFLTGTLILFLFSLFIIVLVMRNRQSNLQLALKTELAEKQYKEQLLFSTIAAAEKERERIARDLHDEMGSILSISISRLRRIQRSSDTFVTEIVSLLEDAQQHTRRIALETFPTTLHMFGLEHSLRAIAEKMRVAVPQVQINYQIGHCQLPDQLSLAIYRIIQELFSNTTRYAQAQTVSVSLYHAPPNICLHYMDNGEGTNLNILTPGLGLKNIYSRLLLVGGDYKIVTTPGNGFALFATIPLTTAK